MSSSPVPPLAPARFRLLTGLFSQRTWREFGFHWAALFLAPFGFGYAVVVVAGGAGISVSFLGIFVFAALVLGARAWGGLYRGLVNRMLDAHVPAPLPRRRRTGFFGFVASGLSDTAGWRAVGHGFAQFALEVIGGTVSVSLFAAGAGGLTYWFWYRYLPLQRGSDGLMHRGTDFGPGYFVDTPGRLLLVAVAGALILLLLWPVLTHAFARAQALLAQSLLGPTSGQQRMARLETDRLRSVQDADAKLRRIERDLHDGAQAQLVAAAMRLGDASERLRAGASADSVAPLVDAAQKVVVDTLAGVRSLARGIHPPALDAGLATALRSLADTVPVPTSVHVELVRRPDPAVESLAYFTTSELVANAVKHAGAQRIAINVVGDAKTVRITVADDGSGGAWAIPGGGLDGLMKRVSAVDGELTVVSPRGGPTSATASLPLAGRA